MPSRPDYEAEGLLDGLEGEALAQRRRLLDRLFDDGAGLEEVSAAVREGRLALLPIERALTGERAYTPREIAERTGVPLADLNRQWQALGMVVGDSDERTRSADELEAAHRVKTFMDAGLSADAITELARLIAMTMSQFAAANRAVINDLIGTEVAGEADLAGVLAGLAETLIPIIGPSFEHVYKLQLREQLRHVATAAGGEAISGAEEPMAIAFADLVDFTRLGERLPPEELGLVTGRFGELAAEAASGPVRLVKLIGDAAMYASTDTIELAGAVLDLLDAVEDEGEGFPGVRAGIAAGPVLPRGGDFYGRIVNIASRVTGIARPGSALVTGEAKEQLEGEFLLSDAGPKHLKGIDAPVHLYRCRDLPEEGEPADREGGADGAGADEAPEPVEPRKRRRRRRRR